MLIGMDSSNSGGKVGPEADDEDEDGCLGLRIGPNLLDVWSARVMSGWAVIGFEVVFLSDRVEMIIGGEGSLAGWVVWLEWGVSFLGMI